jgi:hypothetical protein
MRISAKAALQNRIFFFVFFWMVACTCVATPITEQRQMNQQHRIEQGVDSGRLTRREANKLEAQQNRIERAETRMEANGVVTSSERRRLLARENIADRNIYRKKHNLRRR